MTRMSAPRGSASLDLQIDPNNDCEIFFNKFTRRSTSACVSESCSKMTVERIKRKKRKLLGEREKEGKRGRRISVSEIVVVYNTGSHRITTENNNNITNLKKFKKIKKIKKFKKTYCSYSLRTCLDHNHHQFF